MSIYATASTVFVNPPGASPVLSEEQVWKGLEYKARNPSAFVPMITKCQVVKDEGATLVREVHFNNSPDKVTETIEANHPAIVYFEMDTGTRVTNILSYGSNDELLLTYTFSHGIPGVPADKPRPSSKEINAKVGPAVAHGVEVIRKMVQEGKL